MPPGPVASGHRCCWSCSARRRRRCRTESRWTGPRRQRCWRPERQRPKWLFHQGCLLRRMVNRLILSDALAITRGLLLIVHSGIPVPRGTNQKRAARRRLAVERAAVSGARDQKLCLIPTSKPLDFWPPAVAAGRQRPGTWQRRCCRSARTSCTARCAWTGCRRSRSRAAWHRRWGVAGGGSLGGGVGLGSVYAAISWPWPSGAVTEAVRSSVRGHVLVLGVRQRGRATPKS
jgi:hypothetical protein